MNSRKQLSGKSSYPDQSPAAYGSCCAIDMCNQTSCDILENMEQTKFGLQEEIYQLSDIGCPCDIISIFPTTVQFDKAAAITVVTTGLNAQKVLSIGFVKCRFQLALEQFIVSDADYVNGTFVCLKSFIALPGQRIELSLQGTKRDLQRLHIETLFTLSPSVPGPAGFVLFDGSGLQLTDVTPKQSPAGGGILITAIGAGFQAGYQMSCRVRGVVFPAAVRDNATAVCSTPRLPPGPASVSVSINAFDWAPELPFHVYSPPRIRAALYAGARPNATLTLLADGELPPAADANATWCRFLQPYHNLTVPATLSRLPGGGGAFACAVPENARDLLLPGPNASLPATCRAVPGRPCEGASPVPPDCDGGAVVGTRCFRCRPRPAPAGAPAPWRREFGAASTAAARAEEDRQRARALGGRCEDGREVRDTCPTPSMCWTCPLSLSLSLCLCLCLSLSLSLSPALSPSRPLLLAPPSSSLVIFFAPWTDVVSFCERHREEVS